MTSKAAIPPEFVRYVKEPLAEGFTVEIFEDLHHVLDQYIVELAIKRGSAENTQDVIQEWEREHREKIENKRKSIQAQFGALLPYAFVSSNVKLEYLARSGHESFQSGVISDDVTEIMQEFFEIVAYREDLEGLGHKSGKP